MTEIAHPEKDLSCRLDVIYEDDLLFAVNKPAWWVVHRGLATDRVTLVDVLKEQYSSAEIFPVHRLDRQTSGVLLFARSAQSAREFQRLFEEGQVQKKYIALVRGTAPAEGVIDSPVPKTEGGERVPAITTFSRIAIGGTLPRETSLLAAFPRTGRFHQIRRHMKHINHPIIGDANYGKGQLNRSFREGYQLNRMALHAVSLAFRHPQSGKQTVITAGIPSDLAAPLQQMGYDLSVLQL
ncbi:MAG: RluA family pseudouridine synthase [Deltaproteobacteria bacterium]|nr:RluA family pseudouridine synthase [Deltaproteobacteria bacterium]MBN2674595.1 RluA family pseudouridine synthase [Deltaproteobacteria bacterium]